MTIARRRPKALDVVAAPVPLPAATPEGRAPVSLGDVPAPETVTPAGRLRRCTFRRIDRVSALAGRPNGSTYEVMCLYGSADEPLPLGDVATARPVCDTCTASGIFRPDED